MRQEVINGEVYNIEETLDDIFSYNRKIDFVTECEGHYYIRLEPEHNYDEAMWKVNKKTHKVSCIHLIDYMLDIEDKATPIDSETLRRAS